MQNSHDLLEESQKQYFLFPTFKIILRKVMLTFSVKKKH